MNSSRRPMVIGLLVCFVSMPTVALASGGSGGPPQHPPEQIAAFSKKVEKELGARGARVALISRVGRSPADLPGGIEYTHVGFAVYSQITTADGRKVPGYAIYNLYQDDEELDSSFLKQDFPIDYYAAVFELRAGIIIPEPKLQLRLLDTIFSKTYRSLHNAEYSAISNPYNTKLQNCTEFVLDVMNSAIYATADREWIKAHERAYFKAHPIDVDPLQLLIGSIFVPDISLADHDGPVQTATFGSVASYMEEYGIADEVFTVTADPAPGN